MPCSSMILPPSGRISIRYSPCFSPPRTLSAPTWPSVSAPLDGAVDGHDRDAGVDDRLDRRGERLDVLGRDDDAVDALGDRRLDAGRLRRRVVLAVLLDQLDVELGGLVAGDVHHVDEEREVEPGNREDDLELLVLPGRSRGAGQGYADQQAEQQSHHEQACGHPLSTHRCLLRKRSSRAAHIAGRVSRVLRAIGLDARASSASPVGQRCPVHDRSDCISRATSLAPSPPFSSHRRSSPRVPVGTIGCNRSERCSLPETVTRARGEPGPRRDA